MTNHLKISKGGKTMALAMLAPVVFLPTVFMAMPSMVYAQSALEEIVVTAQRREQSLQEVPISIETFTGAQIERQGYRNMEDLSIFSPSVVVQAHGLDQKIAIRGFGTTGNSLNLEQAVPMFVDGIHYGRQSMIKGAFMDLDRVEVLKGPQPVFFGQNATAGAFSIIPRKPTPTWESNIGFEVGNDSQLEASGGIGGPITDTLGIRVAGIYEYNDGYLNHAVHDYKYPDFGHLGGRVTLEWAPNDKFTATAKYERSKVRGGSEAIMGCLTGDPMIFDPLNTPRSISGVRIDDEGAEWSVWQDPPLGEGWIVPHKELDRHPNCFQGKIGLSMEGPFSDVPLNIRNEDNTTGAIEIRKFAEAFYSTSSQYDLAGIDRKGIVGHDDHDSWTGYLDLVYMLDNGIEINSKTAHVSYFRGFARDDRHSPFLMNWANREEDFNQWSSELRITSPAGGYEMGAGSIEWMLGAFYQEEEKDINNSLMRANVRQGLRFNKIWEDSDWKSVFATLTFNFLDDKASIDIGGRYAEISKEIDVVGYGSNWIFDVRPCAATPNDDIGGGNFNTATCPTQSGAVLLPSSTPGLIIFDDQVDRSNLWHFPYNATRNTPSSWRGGRAEAVGLVALSTAVRPGEQVTDKFSTSAIDPQIVLRWRPSDDHSFFAKWAQAFKAAGYDSGLGTIPPLDEMKFDNENSETFEIGAKGSFWDRRGRYDVTLFNTSFTDLQLSGLADVTNPDTTSISLNAGKQRVKGIEFGVTTAVTDQLLLNLGGAIMDGKMVDFKGSGCNTAEFVNARDNLGIAELAGCDITSFGRPLIDRSGQQAPRTPDWKFVAELTYWVPVLENYRVTYNVQGFMSDGFITSRSGFEQYIRYEEHEDISMNLSFGDQADTWEVMAYARNILEPRPSYNRQYDLPGSSRLGLVSTEVRKSEFFSYGLQFKYNFR